MIIESWFSGEGLAGSLANVVMQACYINFSRSRKFTLLTHKYDVIIGQRTVNSVRAFVY